MSRWLILGCVVLAISTGGLFLLDPVMTGVSLPGAEKLFPEKQLLFDSDEGSLSTIILGTVERLPGDVILLVVVFCVAGVGINLGGNLPEGPFPDSRGSGWIKISGTLIWFVAGVITSLLFIRTGFLGNTSAFLRHFSAGLGLQATMFLSVCLAYVVEPEQFRHSANGSPDPISRFFVGAREFLRFYPFMLLALILNEWIIVNYSTPTLPVSYRFIGAASGGLELLQLLLLIVLVAPIVEEFLFRGILYPGLRDYVPVPGAIVLGGGLFALIHFEHQLLLPLWLFGSFLCYLYERTGSLMVVITIHFLQNTISLYMLKRIMA